MCVTRLEFLVFILYLAANIVPFIWWVRGREEISRTMAMMAAINSIPLSLGGRTNPVASMIGVPLSTYYLAHHWIGRVAIIEGLVHTGIIMIDPLPSNYLFIVSGYLVSIPGGKNFMVLIDQDCQQLPCNRRDIDLVHAPDSARRLCQIPFNTFPGRSGRLGMAHSQCTDGV